MSLLTIFAISSAWAGVADYSGSYSLTCMATDLTLHLGLAASIGGASGSWSDSASLSLDCDGLSDDEEAGLADDISAGCADIWSDEDDCAQGG